MSYPRVIQFETSARLRQIERRRLDEVARHRHQTAAVDVATSVLGRRGWQAFVTAVTRRRIIAAGKSSLG